MDSTKFLTKEVEVIVDRPLGSKHPEHGFIYLANYGYVPNEIAPDSSNQDIGIAANDPEPLYVAASNSGGATAVAVHEDPAAANIDTWTEWVIPLSQFADQGLNLTNVDKIAIGLGTKGNTTVPGGSGKVYFDDIRLYRPAAGN